MRVINLNQLETMRILNDVVYDNPEVDPKPPKK